MQKKTQDQQANEVFFEALASGDVSQAILNQEARGQRELVNSCALPKDIRNASRSVLEQLGFTFADEIDDLFINAHLPEGWKKVPTDHAMWSHIIDEDGHVRAKIFYKAAFYDRRAFMNIKFID